MTGSWFVPRFRGRKAHIEAFIMPRLPYIMIINYTSYTVKDPKALF